MHGWNGHGQSGMEQINTIIEQWDDRIGPLQQKAAENRAAFLKINEQIEKLKTPVAKGGLITRGGGYLRKAFGFAIKAPVLYYKKDLAQLDMQRGQYNLDQFIVQTTAQLAEAIVPTLAKTAPTEAAHISQMQNVLDAGQKARSKSEIAILSCAQASNNIQWANNKYYFNALQRSQNSERDVRQAGKALDEFNTALGTLKNDAPKFATVADVVFTKFGPEYAQTNNAKFSDISSRLQEQRGRLGAEINGIKADLLDALEQAAGKIGIQSRGLSSLIQAAHQRIKPAEATMSGARPKADF